MCSLESEFIPGHPRCLEFHTVLHTWKNTDLLIVDWDRIPVSTEKWECLEGTFTLSKMPDRVVFYLEGPPPGVDLLIKSVVISCSSPTVSNDIMTVKIFKEHFFLVRFIEFIQIAA